MIWNVVIPVLLILAVIKWMIDSKVSKQSLGDFPFPGNKNHSDFKCAYCLHCKKLFDDGVLCKYGKTSTFKNPVHISNCTDFTRNS